LFASCVACISGAEAYEQGEGQNEEGSYSIVVEKEIVRHKV
jgi:hypothetical protein